MRAVLAICCISPLVACDGDPPIRSAPDPVIEKVVEKRVNVYVCPDGTRTETEGACTPVPPPDAGPPFVFLGHRWTDYFTEEVFQEGEEGEAFTLMAMTNRVRPIRLSAVSFLVYVGLPPLPNGTGPWMSALADVGQRIDACALRDPKPGGGTGPWTAPAEVPGGRSGFSLTFPEPLRGFNVLAVVCRGKVGGDAGLYRYAVEFVTGEAADAESGIPIDSQLLSFGSSNNEFRQQVYVSPPPH